MKYVVAAILLIAFLCASYFNYTNGKIISNQKIQIEIERERYNVKWAEVEKLTIELDEQKEKIKRYEEAIKKTEISRKKEVVYYSKLSGDSLAVQVSNLLNSIN